MRGLCLTAIAACLAVTIAAEEVGANIITEPLKIEVVSPLEFAGEIGVGEFSYDDAVVTEGLVTLDPIFGSLTVELTIFGQTFNETNDVDYDFFPELTLSERFPVALDFIISELDPINPTPINDPRVLEIIAITDLIFDETDPFFRGVAAVTPIPEPSSVAAWAGLGLVGGFVCWRRKRKR